MPTVMDFLTSTPHPLKAEIQKARLRLWQLSKATGVSDSLLSRMFSGIKPMPPEIENKIQEILAEIRQPQAATK